MSFTLSYNVVNNVPVIVGTAPGANGGLNISIAIDYTAQANLIVTALQNLDANTNSIKGELSTIDSNIETITLVGTTNTPLQANGFITRSKYEEYGNLLFLQYILDPNLGFSSFPSPLNQQQQDALNGIQSWLSAANTYIPPQDV